MGGILLLYSMPLAGLSGFRSKVLLVLESLDALCSVCVQDTLSFV